MHDVFQTNESTTVIRIFGINNWVVLLLAINCLSALADTQFVCSFGSNVRIQKLDQDNPQPIVEKASNRFTFMFSNNSIEGSFINLKYGLVSPMFVYSNGQTISFIEKNSSDNLFIVTAFVGQQEGRHIPAVFAQNSWSKNIDFYRPFTSLGSCLQTTK